jgi:metal-responsive CopG/Arc/MetJ family transcriptional regulator
MGELKTIISANIPVSIARDLKTKTKGTRSRVVTRALKAYLADQEAFNISDIETRTLLAVLHAREDVSKELKAILLVELNA